METLKHIEFFKTRRSIRKFSDKEISDELISNLIEAASHAPTTGNMQLYSVIVTRDANIKEKLAPAHFSQPAFIGAPVILTFCADHNRFEKWCSLRNALPGYNNFQSFMTAVLDTTIFAQQFCTLAEMNGLGCCYIGTTTYNAPQISEVLNLPNRVVPVTTIAVGWPDGENSISDRLPIEAILHEETYHNYNDESITSIYAEKEERKDSKQFVTENSKQTLAQVFTDVRYTKKDAEFFSNVYLTHVKDKGY
jgi:nitroreductase